MPSELPQSSSWGSSLSVPTDPVPVPAPETSVPASLSGFTSIGTFMFDPGEVPAHGIKSQEYPITDLEADDLLTPVTRYAGPADISAAPARDGFALIQFKNISAVAIDPGQIPVTLFRLDATETTLAPTVKLGEPLYIYPDAGGLTAWNAAIEDYAAAGFVIINPGSGVFAAPDSNFVAVMAQLLARGVPMYGYVSTDYTNRAIAAVLSNLDLYQTHYGAYITGYFIDETDTASAAVPYYQQIYNYAKALDADNVVVMNPGTTGFEESLMGAADIICSFESTYAAYAVQAFPAWQTDGTYDADRFYHIVHDATSAQMIASFTLATQRNAGYVFITDVVSPYFDALPTYWDDLVTLVSGTIENSGTSPRDVAGLKLWLDADRFVTTDVDGVSTWVDGAEGTSLARYSAEVDEDQSEIPLVQRASAINGEAAIEFFGDRPILRNTGFALAQPFTAMIVCKADVGDKVLLGSQNPSGGAGAALYIDGAGYYSMFAGSFEGSASASHLNEWVIVTAIFNGASSKLFVNGIHEATLNPGVAGLNAAAIGSYSDDLWNIWDGRIASVFVWSGGLTDVQRFNQERALAARYGMTYLGDVLGVALETPQGLGASAVPEFAASGSSAASGIVPAPPSVAGAELFLREDKQWANPSRPRLWPKFPALVEDTSRAGITLAAQSEGIYRVQAQTLNATPISAAIWSVEEDKTTHVRATITALKSDGTEGGSWELRAAFRRTGDVVDQIGATINLFEPFKDDAAWDATLVTDGKNVALNLTGAAETIDWDAQVSMVPPAEPDTVFIGVFSDNHSTNAQTITWFDQIKTWADYVISLGDSVDAPHNDVRNNSKMGQYFNNYIVPYNGTSTPSDPKAENAFIGVLGNHNVDDSANPNVDPDVEAANFLTFLNNQPRYGKVRWGHADIFWLNSESLAEPDGITVDSIQYAWFQRELLSSTAPFRFVCFHRSPYGSECAPVNYSPGYTQMRWSELFRQVTAVLSGHQHVYEHIHPTKIKDDAKNGAFINDAPASSDWTVVGVSGSTDIDEVSNEMDVTLSGANGIVRLASDKVDSLIAGNTHVFSGEITAWATITELTVWHDDVLVGTISAATTFSLEWTAASGAGDIEIRAVVAGTFSIKNIKIRDKNYGHYFICPSATENNDDTTIADAERSFTIGGEIYQDSITRWAATTATVGVNSPGLPVWDAGGLQLEVRATEAYVRCVTQAGVVVDEVQFTIPTPTPYALPDAQPSAFLDNLIGYWACEDAAAAAMSDGHGGYGFTVETGAPGSDAAAKVSKGRTFNGTTDAFRSPSATLAALQHGNKDWSWSFWVKPTSTAAEQYIIYQSSAMDLRIVAGGTIRFRIRGPGTVADVTSGNTVTAGVWNHILCWYDDTEGKAKVRVNNGTIAEAAESAPPATSVSGIYVGAASGPVTFFAGSIDEVYRWDRVLSEAEQDALYVPEVYPFDEYVAGTSGTPSASGYARTGLHGNGSPEGVVVGYIGETYIQDDAGGTPWHKISGDGLATGWI